MEITLNCKADKSSDEMIDKTTEYTKFAYSQSEKFLSNYNKFWILQNSVCITQKN